MVAIPDSVPLLPCFRLDGRHCVFGEVVDGMDVVQKIESTPTGPMDRPRQVGGCWLLAFFAWLHGLQLQEQLVERSITMCMWHDPALTSPCCRTWSSRTAASSRCVLCPALHWVPQLAVLSFLARALLADE